MRNKASEKPNVVSTACPQKGRLKAVVEVFWGAPSEGGSWPLLLLDTVKGEGLSFLSVSKWSQSVERRLALALACCGDPWFTARL